MEKENNELVKSNADDFDNIIEGNLIQSLIYVVRGKQVMLDSDLATLYQVETKRLNEAVKRNIARFPERYCFQLSKEDYDNLKSQFATSSLENTYGGRRKLPYVFTEQGISMLSAVLRSDIAVQVSIRIIDTFVEMRKYMANTSLLYDRMNAIEERQITYQNETNEKFDRVFAYISDHEESQQKIFFDGQIYDAFSLLIDLVGSAAKSIVLVDNYVDVGTLEYFVKEEKDVSAIIYTVKKTRLSEKDVETFNQQYPKLEVKYTGVFHDRFLIIDDEKAYHIGASLKDAGKKCFAISLLNDSGVVYDILQRLDIETEEKVIALDMYPLLCYDIGAFRTVTKPLRNTRRTMTKETKVLWVLNIMPPLIGEALGQECSVKEGWISGILKRLVEEENSPCLGICFPVEASGADWSRVLELPALDSGREGKKLFCYGFYEDVQRPEIYEEASLIERFQEILQDFKPDLVHIFGTEYGHTLAMTKAFHRPERTLIGLQGIISACAKEYMADLPEAVQKQVSFRDWLKQDSMKQQQKKFALRGQRETEALKLTGNVTGRTEFDKQEALSIQPQVQYHFMNETLRKEFYTGSWSLDSCKKHRIFFSQADYPLKGFHYLLEAMGTVLQKYPDAEIAVAGNSLVSYESLKDKIKISAYGNYLRKLVKEKKLEGKIHFLGKLSAEEMKAQYLQCHTFVCASSLENSPNSVGEAMLLGVPVIASRTGGIPSMIEDGREGLLFAKGDTKALSEAILTIWGNDEVALRLSENGKKRAMQTHDSDANYRRLLEIYKSIETK